MSIQPIMTVKPKRVETLKPPGATLDSPVVICYDCEDQFILQYDPDHDQEFQKKSKKTMMELFGITELDCEDNNLFICLKCIEGRSTKLSKEVQSLQDLKNRYQQNQETTPVDPPPQQTTAVDQPKYPNAQSELDHLTLEEQQLDAELAALDVENDQLSTQVFDLIKSRPESSTREDQYWLEMSQ